MSKFVKRFVRDERGVSAMEYAVLAGIIVIALVAVSGTFNTQLSRMFTNLFQKVNTAVNNGS